MLPPVQGWLLRRDLCGWPLSIARTISVVVEFARTPIQGILANSTTPNTTVILWPMLRRKSPSPDCPAWHGHPLVHAGVPAGGGPTRPIARSSPVTTHVATPGPLATRPRLPPANTTRANGGTRGQTSRPCRIVARRLRRDAGPQPNFRNDSSPARVRARWPTRSFLPDAADAGWQRSFESTVPFC
jgi:hypothetical protein